MCKKGRILVAESSGIVARDLETLLEDWGYEDFDIVRSDNDAMNRIQEGNPDLVIIDTDLRGKTGGDEIAQTINRHYETPVILLTAWMTKELEKKTATMKSFYCLSKPFDSNELQHIVNTTMTGWEN